MAYKIKAWYNTGFTATNIPDSEATLNNAGASKEFPSLNILSNEWLSSVIIKATKREVSLIDYVKIWDPSDTGAYSAWYYYVNEKIPQQTNAVALSLTPIFMLIGGGVSGIDFITGFLHRKSPEKNPLCNQGYFEDELMKPAKPLHVKYALLGDDGANGARMTRLTATRIDLGTQAYYKDTVIPISKQVKDISGETTTISNEKIGGALAYQTFINPQCTSIKVAGHYLAGDTVSVGAVNQAIPYTLYMGNQDFIDRGITKLRQIGAEGSIIASYMVPSQYIGEVGTRTRFAGRGSGKDPDSGDTCNGMYYGVSSDLINEGTFVPYARTESDSLFQSNYVTMIEGKILTFTKDNISDTPQFLQMNGEGVGVYNGIINDCLYLGPYNAFGIITDGNNKVEVNPERMLLNKTGIYGDISEDSVLLSNSAMVKSFADLRPDGRIYYCFEDIDGNEISESNLGLFLVYGVAGAQWRNCPLSWTDVSGGRLEENQYKTTVSSQQLSFAQGRQGVWNRFANSIGETFSQGNGEQAGVYGALAGAESTALTTTGGIVMKAVKEGTISSGNPGMAMASGALLGAGAVGLKSYQKIVNAAQAYALEQAQELSSYMSSVGVAVPDISFMPQINPLRDVTGAGALVYRYQYDYEDMRRIDTMLTAFGWKTCVVPTKADLTRHQAFDYLEGDVQVKASGSYPYPKWLADGISAELSTGVRIWHQSPIPITADCNPVKEA